MIDDALQGVTDVVRGQDLFWSTSVHRLLQALLGLPQPAYRHHRLVRDAAGQKLSKSTGATGLRELRAAGRDAGRHPPPGRAANCRSLPAVSRAQTPPVTLAGRGMPCWPGRVGGIMAAKPRVRRINTAAKKRPPKKRAPGAAAAQGSAAKPRRKRAAAGAGHGRGRARRLRARGPHAADRHSGDQRSVGDIRSRRTRAALGRHHQGRRRTSGQPCDPVRRCRAQRRRRAGVRQDLFDLRALARNVGDSLAGRAAAKGLRSSVEISEKLAGARGRRSRSAARGAGKPDRQCGEIHRSRAASRCRCRRCARAKGKVGIAFAVSDSGIGLTLAEIKRLFRPFSQANVSIASRFGGAGLGLSSVKQLARAMGGDIVVRRGAAAAPPSR